MNWIWFGVGIMALGTLIALLARARVGVCHRRRAGRRGRRTTTAMLLLFAVALLARRFAPTLSTSKGRP